MDGKIFVLLLLPLVCLIATTNSAMTSMSEKIARAAESEIGSTHWSYASRCCHGKNTNKCNYFVYDVGRKAGAKMPKRGWFRGPIGAGDGGWGKASTLDYWTRVSSVTRGDVIAAHKNYVYHVGIYVGGGMSVSANGDNVAKNSWPTGSAYKNYTDIVYWHYTGLKDRT